MGVNPYINASIIMQLMQGVIPSLGDLAREGEYGRNKLNQYTRLLTVPLAFAQGYGFTVLLQQARRAAGRTRSSASRPSRCCSASRPAPSC